MLGEGSGWLIESADNHYVEIPIHICIGGSSYIELPKKIKNLKKDWI